MIKKSILFFLFLFLNVFMQTTKANIYIYAIIDDEIITNYDVEKESEYLKILNPNLVQLNKKKILELAKNSLIKEIIKKKEIIKFIDISQESPFIQDYLNNLYLKLNFKSENEFKNELIKKNNYTLDQIRQKIKIELFWNELIYSKYKNQLNINNEQLKKKINQFKNKKQKKYFLSEIVFNKNKDTSLDKLIDQIKLSITEIGFDNTANIYSIAESSKLGGKLGWVNESSLSKIISERLTSLNEGGYSDVIKIGNSYVILKVDKIKTNEIKIDKKKELEKLIQVETNKQLNQFSRIFFDKSKINYSINEK
ncbi:peptidyl-prolyl cis-trans isomerase [Candidatus Pelagibacter sp.]|nr:peptidyl-prolyl cis-trans isomerase [Candidatus Pelagibacter sp.]